MPAYFAILNGPLIFLVETSPLIILKSIVTVNPAVDHLCEIDLLSESDKKNIMTMLNKLSTKEITNIISQSSNVSKKEIYEYCVKLKNEK